MWTGKYCEKCDKLGFDKCHCKDVFVKFCEEVAKEPYPDSDLSSLFMTLHNRAKHILNKNNHVIENVTLAEIREQDFAQFYTWEGKPHNGFNSMWLTGMTRSKANIGDTGRLVYRTSAKYGLWFFEKYNS